MKRLALIVMFVICALSVIAQTKTGEQQSTPVKSATDDPTYLIGAEDMINVGVWKEPDFSSTVPVRPDGMVSLPLLGDVPAAGKTPAQLAQDLTIRLKKYIDDPRVTVTVTAINSKRIYVLGEVNHPGTMVMSPNMTVLQAISAAGGLTAYANAKRINVLRTEQGKQTKYLFNYKEFIKGNNPEQNIALKSGDTIVVP